MKKTVLFIAAIAMMASLASCGKKELFNGRDLEGWVLFVDPSSEVPASDVFLVKDGNILIKGMPYGYMRTEEKYGDYKLHMEWRWVEGGSNSGFFQRVQDGDKLWPMCVECQLGHGSVGDLLMLGAPKGPDGRSPRTTRNGDYENPVGEWNTVEVICEGREITVYLNGQLQNQATCEYTDGYIALQSEGGPLEIRNIYFE